MGEEATPDFSGYATKAGIKCADGRTITPAAFEHQNGASVPLVWQHNHSTPDNVLGHAILEHRSDGMYARAYFNDTPQAVHAKTLVGHKDIVSLSIYANGLVEKAGSVLHGVIRELSLVLSGANPGALIDYITLQHSDGEMVTLEDEAIIYMGLELEHAGSTVVEDIKEPDAAAETENVVAHDLVDDQAMQAVYSSLSDDQKDLVHLLVGMAVNDANMAEVAEDAAEDAAGESDSAAAQSGTSTEDQSLVHDDTTKEGRRMTRNVFEQQKDQGTPGEDQALSHDALMGIVADGVQRGSLRAAFEHYALVHGINDIDVLFPNARNVDQTPQFLSRRIEWVQGVLDGTRQTPFSRIRSIVADLTFDEARAKGYIKGNLKKEEWFGVSRRITTPSTVYKKQKLDRDDIVDITDFDVVVWLKAEMRLMFDEEVARAILIGDGRDVGDEDKIRDPSGATEGAGIRSILHDHDAYAMTVTVDDAAAGTVVVDGMTQGMSLYRGSGSPTLYTTLTFLTNLLMTRDSFGHRLWRTSADLASEIGVANIVNVEVMQQEEDLLGIIVNLADYTVGTDKGGEVNFFDFFDIDYNQYKYLYESRMSGALTKLRSAIVVKRAAPGATLVVPTEPGFDGTVVTIPTVTGVTYTDASDNSTLTGTVTLASGDSLTVVAIPTSDSYYFADNQHDQWTFTNES